jgi:hypothetical protein
MERSLDDRVRHYIGEGGPQLSIDEYRERVERELERMSPADLLRFISYAIEDMFEEIIRARD